MGYRNRPRDPRPRRQGILSDGANPLRHNGAAVRGASRFGSAHVMHFNRAGNAIPPCPGTRSQNDGRASGPADPHGRGAPFWFQQMDAPRPQRNRVHLDIWVPYDQAEARVTAAIAAGGRLVSDEHAPEWWTLADSEGNEADVATTATRD